MDDTEDFSVHTDYGKSAAIIAYFTVLTAALYCAVIIDPDYNQHLRDFTSTPKYILMEDQTDLEHIRRQ